MARPKNTTAPPEWFSLEKYKDCKKFSAVEWLEQLARRQSLIDLTGELPALEQNYHLRVEEWNLDNIRKFPLGTYDKYADWLTSPRNRPIRPLTVRDANLQALRDIKAEANGDAPAGTVKPWHAIVPERMTITEYMEVSQKAITLGDHKPGSNDFPILVVDLEASDKDLKEAFSLWLSEARPSKRNSPPYSSWDSQKILPYLDLWIWGLETGRIISDSTMAEVLFPGMDDGVGRIRTTKKNAAELMKDLSTLLAIASISG